MNFIEIRKAILNDIPQIVKLHIESWNETYKGIISQDYLDNMKKNERNAIERTKKEFNLKNIIVAIYKSEIIAFSEFTFSNEFSMDLDIDCV